MPAVEIQYNDIIHSLSIPYFMFRANSNPLDQLFLGTLEVLGYYVN